MVIGANACNWDAVASPLNAGCLSTMPHEDTSLNSVDSQFCWKTKTISTLLKSLIALLEKCLRQVTDGKVLSCNTGLLNNVIQLLLYELLLCCYVATEMEARPWIIVSRCFVLTLRKPNAVFTIPRNSILTLSIDLMMVTVF